jgi:hypothetical protein
MSVPTQGEIAYAKFMLERYAAILPYVLISIPFVVAAVFGLAWILSEMH